MLSSLATCRYRHVAICNLVYQGELAAAMKAAMPEKFQHIYVAGNSALPKGSYGVMQAMNMSNFVPNQSCLPADQVHINVQVEIDDEQAAKNDLEAVKNASHSFLLKSFKLESQQAPLHSHVKFLRNGFPLFTPGDQMKQLAYLINRKDQRFAVTGNYLSKTAVSFAIKLAKSQVCKLI